MGTKIVKSVLTQSGGQETSPLITVHRDSPAKSPPLWNTIAGIFATTLTAGTLALVLPLGPVPYRLREELLGTTATIIVFDEYQIDFEVPSIIAIQPVRKMMMFSGAPLPVLSRKHPYIATTLLTSPDEQ